MPIGEARERRGAVATELRLQGRLIQLPLLRRCESGGQLGHREGEGCDCFGKLALLHECVASCVLLGAGFPAAAFRGIARHLLEHLHVSDRAQLHGLGEGCDALGGTLFRIFTTIDLEIILVRLAHEAPSESLRRHKLGNSRGIGQDAIIEAHLLQGARSEQQELGGFLDVGAEIADLVEATRIHLSSHPEVAFPGRPVAKCLPRHRKGRRVR
mmetsp:Transcript_26922/g.55687  ORF Transcript_26922/g.55687 Transcript_26922/m.55687 type:complete len:213 (-) Transcript_26922:2098-2736(-)